MVVMSGKSARAGGGGREEENDVCGGRYGREG